MYKICLTQIPISSIGFLKSKAAKIYALQPSKLNKLKPTSIHKLIKTYLTLTATELLSVPVPVRVTLELSLVAE